MKKLVYIFLGIWMLWMPWNVWGQSQDLAPRIQMTVEYGFANQIKDASCVPVRVTLLCAEGEVSGMLRLEIPVWSQSDLDTGIWLSDGSGIQNRECDYVWEREIFLKEGEKTEEIFYLEFPIYEGNLILRVSSQGKILAEEELTLDVQENSSAILIGVISKESDQIALLDGSKIESDAYYAQDLVVHAFALESEDICEHPQALDHLDVLIVDEDTVFTKEQSAALAIWQKNGGIYCRKGSESLWDTYQHLERTEQWESLRQVNYLLSYGDIFDEIPLKEKVSIGWYIVLILLYLLAVGPGLYWMLHRKKSTSWLIASVCILSLSFVVLIGLIGQKSHMDTITVAYETLYEQEADYVTETVDFAVQAYRLHDYEVSLDASYEILPQSIGYEAAETSDAKTAELVTIQKGEKQISLHLQNMSALKQNKFQAFKYTLQEKQEQIQVHVVGTADGVQVQWENPTPYHIPQVICVLKNRLAVLGEMEPYSEGVWTGSWDVWNSNNILLLLQDKMEETRKGFGEYEQKSLSHRIVEEAENQDEVFLIGIVDNAEEIFETNTALGAYGVSMLKIHAQADWQEGDLRWCSNLEIYGTSYRGDYDANENLLLSQEAVIDYQIGFLGELQSLSLVFPAYNRKEYEIPFEGKIYVFHWKEGIYEQWTNWQETLSPIRLDDYVSDTGVLRMYYRMDEWIADSNQVCRLPYIKASGKVIK